MTRRATALEAHPDDGKSLQRRWRRRRSVVYFSFFLLGSRRFQSIAKCSSSRCYSKLEKSRRRISRKPGGSCTYANAGRLYTFKHLKLFSSPCCFFFVLFPSDDDGTTGVCVCGREYVWPQQRDRKVNSMCKGTCLFMIIFLSLSPAGGELLGGSTKSFTWCRILSFSFISSCTAQLLLFRFTTTLSLLKFTNLFSSSSSPSHLPDVVRVGTRSGHGGQTVAPTCGRRRWWRDEPSLRYTHSRPRSLESQPIVTRPVIKAVDDLYGGNQGDSWRREKLGCGHLSLVEGKKEKNKRNWAGRYIHTYAAAVCSKGKVIINTFYLLQTYTHVIFRVGPWNKKKKELRKSQVL